MSLEALLHDIPLWSQAYFPPINNEIIILCAHTDIQYIPKAFSEYKVRLIISNKLQEEFIELDNENTMYIDIDFKKKYQSTTVFDCYL
jgi:hypothetical protein